MNSINVKVLRNTIFTKNNIVQEIDESARRRLVVKTKVWLGSKILEVIKKIKEENLIRIGNSLHSIRRNQSDPESQTDPESQNHHREKI
jgi:hypothetical protein